MAAASASALVTGADRAEPVLARFVLLGQDCVVVAPQAATSVGRHRLGHLLVDGQRYLILGKRKSPAVPDSIDRLTPRELEIALLIAGGCCDKMIARRLGISCHTVGAHVGRIFAKLAVHKRTELSARVAQRPSSVP
jgi:DNA-binding NarL/FixJ family response regulator